MKWNRRTFGILLLVSVLTTSLAVYSSLFFDIIAKSFEISPFKRYGFITSLRQQLILENVEIPTFQHCQLSEDEQQYFVTKSNLSCFYEGTNWTRTIALTADNTTIRRCYCVQGLYSDTKPWSLNSGLSTLVLGPWT